VNSGTDALILALRALEIGKGDEVITVPNSFVTTASSIVCVGATPVFIDVRSDYNINPELIEPAITEKTKAILPVHLTGRPADMGRITEIAKACNLYIIEDCAQAVCAEYKGKKVGSFSDIAAFSLHPLKTLSSCGDGGVLLTKSRELYEKLKILRNNGLKNRNEAVVFARNSRLDTVQAAALLVKLKYLERWTEKRIENAKLYQELLSDVKDVQTPVDTQSEKAVYHTFVISAERRDELAEYLLDNGIETKVHYPIPIHLQEAARRLGYKKGDFPVAESQAERTLSLPVYHSLKKEEIECISKCIMEFYRG
jgi:dTDP-4-amino-4,6-dideoxygalactose transaminase